MATLLFLGASVSQAPAIRHARAAGHRVVAVDGDPQAVGFAFADASITVSFTHVEQVLAASAEHRVDGVLAVSSDRAVVPAAAIAEALGLPGIGIDVARAMTDKPTMRARLDRAGVAQPRHAVVASGTDLLAVAHVVPLPAVLKPADSGGQRGLFLVRDVEEIREHLDEALSFSTTGCALLEEYIDGIELNGILVVRDGEPTLVTLSDRLRPGGRGFGVGWIHLYPSSLDGEVLERARELAFAAVSALGLRDGIAFPQLIAAGDDVRIVEIAARIAAGQMADLVRFGTGIELFDVAIAQALGQPVSDQILTPSLARPVAIRFLTARPGVLPVGTVVGIDGLEAVRTSPGVLGAGLYFGTGATIGPVRVDADRRGYVAATADTPEAALDLADAAARKLVVRTRRDRRLGARVRLLVPAAVTAVAAALLLALVGLDPHVRPRLVSDRIHAGGGLLSIRYAFNEPVRVLLLVNGKPRTAFSSLRRSGQLLWRGHASGPISIKGVDSAGQSAVFTVSTRATGGVRARPRGAA